MTSDLVMLKTMMRETDMPMFSDEELQALLDKNVTVENAAYEGLILKSENTSLQLSGLSIPDTSKYFLRIASMYRPSNTGTLGGG